VETKRELKPREVRVVDFVAELLDEEANKMPPSYKERGKLAQDGGRNAAIPQPAHNPCVGRKVRKGNATDECRHCNPNLGQCDEGIGFLEGAI
jgi:hypothetical protein